MEKNILVISGPTGVGESTITNEIIKRYPIFKRLVAATTRKPRLNEKEGIDYYFMDNEQFKKEIKNGNIPEYQDTRENNNYYGSYKVDLDKKINAGYKIIANPDIVGTRYFKKHHNSTSIFILPDSLENLKIRHLHRDPHQSEEELKDRLDYAQYEIENEAKHYDFKVINKQNKLEKTLIEIEKILKKEGYL